MAQPIDDPKYWAQRLREAEASGQIHHAVFKCARARWEQIAAKHTEILARHIKIGDSVLDCACGWGRLVFMLPPLAQWQGPYLGVDISPDFIMKALTQTVPAALKAGRGGCAFQVADLRTLSKQVMLLLGPTTCPDCKGTGDWSGWDCGPPEGDGRRCEKCQGRGIIDKLSPRKWGWGVLVSVRPMIKREMGGEVWDAMETEIRKVADKLLYLEYDPFDEGSVE